MNLRRNPTARALDEALSGGPAGREVRELVSLASELRDVGLAAPQPRLSPARREELRAAVLARSVDQRRGGSVGRVRGATFGVAAVAGAGLVVASAASGSNPAVLVADVAREIPRVSFHAAPPADLAIEGEVIASYNDGRTLEVRSHGETFVVESRSETRSVSAEGTPVAASAIEQGANIRVTTESSADSGVVAAKKIEVLPPTAALEPRTPLSAAAADAKTRTPTAPAKSGSNVGPQPAAPTKTPSPSPTKPATASPTPLANVTSVVVAPVEPIKTPTKSPTLAPTRTPTARPKETATVVPYANSLANSDAEAAPGDAAD